MNEMVRGVYIQRAPAERMTVEDALKHYLAEVSPPSAQHQRPAMPDTPSP